MLTSRGWWFLVFLLVMLAAPVWFGVVLLALVFLTLLLWFAAEWLLFVVRVRFVVPRLVVERGVFDERGRVETLWAGRTFAVRVRIRIEGLLGLAHVSVQDRVPFALTFASGVTHASGPLGGEQALDVRYTVRCPAPGQARFEGICVRVADLQGFFCHTVFLQQAIKLPVLPPLTDAQGRSATVKRHNLLPSPGQHRHLRPGSGSELLDLRDYLPGDPPKTIAWKVSARRDRLMTKEFESEVPVRCTLFVDTSNSVRVGPPGKNALTRLTEIAAACAQANAAARDLTGLCLFDETNVTTYLRPARGQQHLVRQFRTLAGAAALAPTTGAAEVEQLLPLAWALAEEVYPQLLRPAVNAPPAWWSAWLRPRPAWSRRQRTLADRLYGLLPLWLLALLVTGMGLSVVAGVALAKALPDLGLPWWLGGCAVALGWFFGLSLTQRLLFARRRARQRRRKPLAALLSVHQGLAPGGLPMLMEDDEQCSLALQRFLAEHHVPYTLPYYGRDGRYLFASPGKIDVLARALLRAVGKGRDNELFVLLADLLELADELAPLLRAVKVALARHHQVMVVCPWPPGVPPIWREPSGSREIGSDVAADVFLADAVRFHQAYHHLRRTFARIGVPVICAHGGDPVRLILDRLNRLRSFGRRR